MKKILLLSLMASCVLLVSCNKAQNTDNKEAATDTTATISDADIKNKSFDELFKAIDPEQISENIFKLVSKDNTVITAGTDSLFNSMVAGDGGVGILKGKPVTWCGLRASRYTLEIIEKDKIYTMTYFEEKYRDQFMAFGKTSGRDSNKMKETTLTPIVTPSGKVAYKEAKLIIECKLAQTLTVDPNQIYAEDNKQFFVDANKEVGAYHKIVFGDITNVWVRK